MNKTEKTKEYCTELIDFIKNSGCSFLACNNIKNKLKKENLKVLNIDEIWNLKKNEGYIICKENRCIISFFIGKNFNLKDGYIVISVAHLDSPCLKISTNNKLEKNKLNQINVECYGGGLWTTWFDRGLGLSGQVIYKENDKIIEKLIHINKSLFYIPSLAIHLQSASEYPIKVDYEKHLKPIISTVYSENKRKQTEKSNESAIECENIHNKNISSTLLYILSKELQCKEEDILDFELCLIDSNSPCFCGVYDEFIESSRLDNLGSTYGTFQAYTELINEIKDKDYAGIYMCISYDHEEVGSQTQVGGKSEVTKNIIERILSSIFHDLLNSISLPQIYSIIMSKSLLLSVDMAHCTHPNYPDHYQQQHEINFNEGIVIKYNTRKNYITSSYYVSLIKKTFEIYKNMNNEIIKYQNFIVKNTMGCGSTVGPMLATNLNIPGVDIGIPQLAMHSIREFMGTHDLFYLIKGVLSIFLYYNQAFKSIKNIE